jgi:3-oxoacyl-[acyl-carrier protein] reductase
MVRNGKVALITGATRGIGRAVAFGLAQDGYDLALTARTQMDLSDLLAELQSRNDLHGDHTVHVLDVSDSEAIQSAIVEIHKHYGRIDVLVNNAGAYIPGGTELAIQEMDRMLRVNLLAPFQFMQAVLPMMKHQGTGHVFNIASRAGKVGFAGDGGYVASKFGLVGLSESIYRECASAGISVTALCPGWTNTAMAQDAGTPLTEEEMIQPRDILETLRWLLRLSPSVRVKEVILECRHSLA